MPVIVEHEQSGARYALVGAGYGLAATARPSLFGGALIPVETETLHTMLAVCDNIGRIGWLPSSELRIVSIDGTSPDQIETLSSLSAIENRAVPGFECPRCNIVTTEVTPTGECTRCGAPTGQ